MSDLGLKGVEVKMNSELARLMTGLWKAYFAT